MIPREKYRSIGHIFGRNFGHIFGRTFGHIFGRNFGRNVGHIFGRNFGLHAGPSPGGGGREAQLLSFCRSSFLIEKC
jgi:hypothetical protein